jgi:hypothetical protein
MWLYRGRRSWVLIQDQKISSFGQCIQAVLVPVCDVCVLYRIICVVGVCVMAHELHVCVMVPLSDHPACDPCLLWFIIIICVVVVVVAARRLIHIDIGMHAPLNTRR